MFKISTISRIVLALGALSLTALLGLPIWKIVLSAPQYPEGLEMKIWHDTITGDVKIISALNHYIGMRAISVEMFPELQYIGKVIMAVSAACLVLALIGRWWSALVFYLTLAVADSLALYDFYRWGYDYGHNLNPDAAIIIPGMAYQPPVLGYKKLLNFEAWSLPDWGGWILMVVTVLSFLIVVYEWWRHRRHRQTARVTAAKPAALAAAAFVFPLLFWHCAAGPRPIQYGNDACAFCKMTLMDQHYGAELVTQKGKVFILDDMNCLVRFLNQDPQQASAAEGIYLVDYLHAGRLIRAENAFFFHSDDLKTPMASGFAAFSDAAGLQSVSTQTGGAPMTWEQVKNTVK